MQQICDEETFTKLIMDTPGLCAWGMASKSLCNLNRIFYRVNRYLLFHSYREFEMCCTWLRDSCAPVKTVSTKAPTSRLLQQMAKTPHYVGHGAMIAALIHMGYPFKVNPHSPSVQVGVSLRSSCFRLPAIHRIPLFLPALQWQA